jgi:putative oxidoreductase
MIDIRTAPYAALLLRVTMGTAFLAHSILLKFLTLGLEGTAEFFASIGLPGSLAYVVFVAEVLGGAALVLGVHVRWVAAALTPIMLGAAWAHANAGWLFSNPRGGWEYPVFWTAALLVQTLLGDGKFALMPSRWPARSRSHDAGEQTRATP